MLMSDKGMIDLRIAEKGVGIERTAEWVYENANKLVTKQTNNRVRVIKVEVWEHEGNSAIYEELLNATHDIGHINLNPGMMVDEETVSLNDLKQREIEAAAIINDEVISEPIRITPLQSKKTTGYSGFFDGTSWGS